jgi:hypothetical protein
MDAGIADLIVMHEFMPLVRIDMVLVAIMAVPVLLRLARLDQPLAVKPAPGRSAPHPTACAQHWTCAGIRGTAKRLSVHPENSPTGWCL